MTQEAGGDGDLGIFFILHYGVRVYSYLAREGGAKDYEFQLNPPMNCV